MIETELESTAARPGKGKEEFIESRSQNPKSKALEKAKKKVFNSDLRIQNPGPPKRQRRRYSIQIPESKIQSPRKGKEEGMYFLPFPSKTFSEVLSVARYYFRIMVLQKCSVTKTVAKTLTIIVTKVVDALK